MNGESWSMLEVTVTGGLQGGATLSGLRNQKMETLVGSMGTHVTFIFRGD